MLSKSLTASVLLLALTSSANAQNGCAVSPAMGVSGGTPGSNNIEQPTDNSPCGGISISQNIDSSTFAEIANGRFMVNVIDFVK